ncbi:MAG TPA: LPS export ABC transporter periplasmic protein LptC [Cytophagales bacterium]|nr:LPS export ABC transporter periplasmic protein LptC [Cytophagales bacterium]HAA23381.1 LPS export ABC transporter periplasmic protein LptC [Cytophagales bacterium]HAP58139.1 LPS export ABC transporter periplasmic protein LptC [Cytophagales bacterium]
MKLSSFTLAAGLLVIISACSESRQLSEMPEYEGAWLVANNIETIMSDSALVRIKLTAPKQLEYKRGDREFPDGLHMDFVEADGHSSSTVDAEKGYYYMDTELWKVVGNVVLQGLDQGERLTTEELWWDPGKREVFTEDNIQVTIREGNEVLTGYGLKAKQDFSEYELSEITGEFSVEEDEDEREVVNQEEE